MAHLWQFPSSRQRFSMNCLSLSMLSSMLLGSRIQLSWCYVCWSWTFDFWGNLAVAWNFVILDFLLHFINGFLIFGAWLIFFMSNPTIICCKIDWILLNSCDLIFSLFQEAHDSPKCKTGLLYWRGMGDIYRLTIPWRLVNYYLL